MNQDLTEGKPLRSLFLFTLPIIGGNLFQLCYTLADTLIVGQTIGEDALAAVGSTSVFIYFIIKKKRTDVKSIFKYIVLPFIGIFILCYIFTGFDKVSYIVGGIWLVAGLVVGFVQSKGYKIVPEGFKNIEM